MEVSRGPCPACDRQRSCATYDDGHTYCFGCAAVSVGGAPVSPEVTRRAKQFKPLEEGEYRAIKKRGLKADTLRFFDYRLAGVHHYATFYNTEGHAVAQKRRGADKKFIWLGDVTSATLFGQQRWRNAHRKRVVVTEGELDAMSLSQVARSWPVVSVQNGAASAATSIRNSLEWLCEFEEVVFMFDNDEPGEAAAKACAKLLPPGKAKIAKLPLKDANAMLVAGRRDELLKAMWAAEPFDAPARTASAGPLNSLNGVSPERLTNEIYRQLQRLMARRELTLGAATWDAMHALCEVFTDTALGKQQDRLVISVPTGGGKTSLAIAFLAALDALEINDVGVVVCQNRIGALAEMRHELRELRVAPARITLLHSDKQIEERADTHSPDDARQFVLMTHAAVADCGRLHAYQSWQERPRVVIWDEALWTQSPQNISIRDVVMQRAELKFHAGMSKASASLAEAVEYVENCEPFDFDAVADCDDDTNDELAKAVARIKADENLQEVHSHVETLETAAKEAAVRCAQGDESSEVVEFKACDDYEQLVRMTRALQSQPRAHFPALVALLAVAQIDQALVRVGDCNSGGVISFSEAVPKNLGGILVLDASWQVRDVLHADTTLRSVETVPVVAEALRKHGLKTLSDLKTYNHVKVRQILASGGRRSIVGRKREKKTGDLEKETPVVLPLVVDAIVEEWDAGAGGALVFLFKASRGDPSAVDELCKALEKRRKGITVAEAAEQVDGSKPRWLQTAHHGSETGFNRARHCALVIIWGTLHENDDALAAKTLAAHNDIGADVSKATQRHYAHTEKLDRLLQALSRGSLRNPGADPGEASPMRALVIDADPQLGIDMMREFTGIEWKFEPGPWRHSKQERGLSFLAGGALQDFLAGFAGDRVSSRVAKAAAAEGLGEPLATTSWQRIRDEVLPKVGWKSSGSWLERG